MRHPAEELGEKRVCPITGRQFMETWSDKAIYDSCLECKPSGLKVAERLALLAEKRSIADD